MRQIALLVVVLLFIAAPAIADRHPDCKDSTLRDQAATVDATQNATIEFCAPSHGSTLVALPDDFLMTCTLIVGGSVVEEIQNVGPEQLMPYTNAELRFSHSADIVCASAEGEGRLVAVVSATFPPDAPGRPSILSGP